MSDDSLKQLILTLAATAGISREKAEALTKDIPTLRRKMEAMNDRQFNDLIASLRNGGAKKLTEEL